MNLQETDGACQRFGGPREIPALRVEVPASALENKSQLAKLIVAEMLREIRRAP